MHGEPQMFSTQGVEQIIEKWRKSVMWKKVKCGEPP